MKGCFLLIVGAVFGAVILVMVQAFVTKPSPLPAAASSNADLIILFRNEFLTRTLKAQLGQVGNGMNFDRVVVQGEADQTLVLVGTASTRAVSVSVPIRITLRPSVSNNRIGIQVVRAELGALTLPGQLFSQIEGPINDQINTSLASASYRIVNVSTTVDGLVVDVVLTN